MVWFDYWNIKNSDHFSFGFQVFWSWWSFINNVTKPEPKLILLRNDTNQSSLKIISTAGWTIGATDSYFRWLLTVFFIQATPGWWLSMRFLRPTGWSRSQGQNWWNWRMLKSFWCQIKVKNSDKNWSEYIIFTSFTLRQKKNQRRDHHVCSMKFL